MVRIRLKRMGKKGRAFYRICAFDAHSPRDGSALENLGTYDPRQEKPEDKVKLDRERVVWWLEKGAKPTEKVGVLLRAQGIDARK